MTQIIKVDETPYRELSKRANESLRSAVTVRCNRKIEAGHKASPGGLMKQINKRIKAAFGVSVTERKEDEEFQEAIAFTRSVCTRKLSQGQVDWDAEDFKKQDKAVKDSVYANIERMASAFKASTGE